MTMLEICGEITVIVVVAVQKTMVVVMGIWMAMMEEAVYMIVKMVRIDDNAGGDNPNSNPLMVMGELMTVMVAVQ